MRYSLAFVCASNSEAILANNLAASPLIKAGAPLHIARNAPSAAIAYNQGLQASDSDIVVFLHHDVYLPNGWEHLLHSRLDELDRHDPNWALAGAYGVAQNYRQFGPVWSSSLGQIIGRVPLAPEPVTSFDEMLIVMRRSAQLTFDDSQPGWHMYGTDIVCRARAQGKGAYAVGLNCIHNDRFHDALGPDFTQSYRWMQQKWPQYLPLQTPVTKLSRLGLPLLRERWNMRRARNFRATMAVDHGTSPLELAARCGWTQLC